MLFALLCSMVLRMSFAVSIGRVRNARFTSVDLLNTDAVWINNQSTAAKCLCTVRVAFPTASLFNSFTNGSCQLFFALPYTYKMVSSPSTTLILLQPLPARAQAPCCSNLTWLMNRMISSALPVTAFNAPTYLAIDDEDYLGVVAYNDKFYRFNRTTMAQLSSKVIATLCVSVTYYKGKYFIGKSFIRWLLRAESAVGKIFRMWKWRFGEIVRLVVQQSELDRQHLRSQRSSRRRVHSQRYGDAGVRRR